MIFFLLSSISRKEIIFCQYIELEIYYASHSKKGSRYFKQVLHNSKKVELWSLKNRIKEKEAFVTAQLFVGFFQKKNHKLPTFCTPMLKKGNRNHPFLQLSLPQNIWKMFNHGVTEPPLQKKLRKLNRISSCLYKKRIPHILYFLWK